MRLFVVMGEAQDGREVGEVSPNWTGCGKLGRPGDLQEDGQMWDRGPEVRERSGPRHLEVISEEQVPNTRGLDQIWALGSAQGCPLLRLSQR